MKGISRRARACAVVAATGVAVLAGARRRAGAAAREDRQRHSGRSGSTQMFNYGDVLEQRRQHWRRQPGHRCARHACLTSHRRHHLPPRAPRRPVRVLPAQGLDQHRALRALRFPGAERHSGPGRLPRAARQVRPARGRLARHRDRRRPGVDRAPRRVEDPRHGLHRLGRRRLPGHQHVRQHAAHRGGAQPPGQGGRRGRRRPRLHPQPHGRVRRQVRRQRRPEVRLADPHGPHRLPLRAGRGRRLLVLGRVQRRHRRGDRGAGQRQPDAREDDAHQGRHQHRRASHSPTDSAPVRRARRAPASSTSARSSPPRKNKVQYYHHEHDGGTITDADTSFTNLHADRPVHRSGGARPPDELPDGRGRHAGRRERRRREDHEHGRGAAGHHRPRRSPTATRRSTDAGDFAIVREHLRQRTSPPAPQRHPGRPARHVHRQGRLQADPTNTRSVALLRITSNADNATESILLTGSSNGNAIGGVGGAVRPRSR